MGVYIGSEITSGTLGEKKLIEKCKSYMSDNVLIFKNKEVNGYESDIILLMPERGIIIIEVKDWKPENVYRNPNGDCINLIVGEGKIITQSPRVQARGYRFDLKNFLDKKLGKHPLVKSAICLTNMSLNDVHNKQINETIIPSETTFFKEDLDDRNKFLNKIKAVMGVNKSMNFSEFNYAFVREVAELFVGPYDDWKGLLQRTVQKAYTGQFKDYSKFYHIINWNEDKAKEISAAYISGVKIIAIVSNVEIKNKLALVIAEALKSRGLYDKDETLIKIKENDPDAFTEIKLESDKFSVFNCNIFVSKNNIITDTYDEIEVINGDLGDEDSYCYATMKILAENSNFNFDQYRIEHCDCNSNIIVEAGAGSGKTYTMISRIAFICYSQSASIASMAERIVMITFTDDSANEMKRRIKSYFINYFNLSRKPDVLEFINSIEKMQISTIHSYARKIINMLGVEFGYGSDIKITSSQYLRQQYIAQEFERYIDTRKQDLDALDIRMYDVKNILSEIIEKLYNQSVAVEKILPENFGNLREDSRLGRFIHEAVTTVVPAAEQRYKRDIFKANKMHLNEMMPLLKKCIDCPENVKRLKLIKADNPQFMFVDEFQDTDDVQIEIVKLLSHELGYKLFVVGDIKQCIYRFRGATTSAFETLVKNNVEKFLEPFHLNKNYRTDNKLLDIYHESFKKWGAQGTLVYKDKDKLTGMTEYNGISIPTAKFYSRVVSLTEDEMLENVFSEIRRYREEISGARAFNKKLKKQSTNIAVLVRENWQAEKIREYGKLHHSDLNLVLNTGGDLFKEAPAIDMLVLINALLHYDEIEYLYRLIDSNFIGYKKRIAMFNSQNNRETQKCVLINIINERLKPVDKSWDDIINSLRSTTVLQVLRELYDCFKPWIGYSEKDDDRQYYRLNTDLLIENIIAQNNTDSLTVNKLQEFLLNSIRAGIDVDCRTLDKENKENLIYCITVHKSKGLEYGAVILPYAFSTLDKLKSSKVHLSVENRDGLLKIGYKIKIGRGKTANVISNSLFTDADETLERKYEEMRVLYVAMTRAIHSFSLITLEDEKGQQINNWQNSIVRLES